MREINVTQELAIKLQAEGILATYEFPGYIHLDVGPNVFMAFGFVNGPLGMTLWGYHGRASGQESTIPEDPARMEDMVIWIKKQIADYEQKTSQGETSS